MGMLEELYASIYTCDLSLADNWHKLLKREFAGRLVDQFPVLFDSSLKLDPREVPYLLL